jgi:hypothetical protein
MRLRARLANFSKNPSMANESTSIMTTPKKIAPKKWKPKIGEIYYSIYGGNYGYYVDHWEFTNGEMNKRFIRANNYFRTYELAETVGLAIGKLFKESEHG